MHCLLYGGLKYSFLTNVNKNPAEGPNALMLAARDGAIGHDVTPGFSHGYCQSDYGKNPERASETLHT